MYTNGVNNYNSVREDVSKSMTTNQNPDFDGEAFSDLMDITGFLALAGIPELWVAVFADVGVCLLAILNATRAMKLSKGGNQNGTF